MNYQGCAIPGGEIAGALVGAIVLAASRLVPIDAKPASAVRACDFTVEEHCPSVLAISRLYALSLETFLVQTHLSSEVSTFPLTDDRFSKVQHHLQLLPHGIHHAHSKEFCKNNALLRLMFADVTKERGAQETISFLRTDYREPRNFQSTSMRTNLEFRVTFQIRIEFMRHAHLNYVMIGWIYK